MVRLFQELNGLVEVSVVELVEASKVGFEACCADERV